MKHSILIGLVLCTGSCAFARYVSAKSQVVKYECTAYDEELYQNDKCIIPIHEINVDTCRKVKGSLIVKDKMLWCQTDAERVK